MELAAGQSAPVTIQLDARSFSYWDEASHGWQVAAGACTISVGNSSRDLPVRDTFETKLNSWSSLMTKVVVGTVRLVPCQST